LRFYIPIRSFNGHLLTDMSITIKFHINIGGDHNDIETFYRFRYTSTAPVTDQLTISFINHILPLFVLQIVTHRFTLHCEVLLLIKTFCLDISDEIR
jgi:hypothetical protein